jgi:enterochelin esterase family protein
MNVLTDLLKRVVSDPAAAEGVLEDFVASHAFPLISGESATFFFWIGEPLDAVHLVHWVFGLESRQPFHRVPHTDAWYLTLDLPRRSRIEYKIEIHRSGGARWVRDPHNDLRAFDPFGSNSVCTTPGYVEPVWVQPEAGVRSGDLSSFSFDSAVYGDQREIKVYLPQEYKPHKLYPLLICHDGDDYLRFAAMQQVLDNLIQRREVRPLIVAFTRGHDRNHEYGANPRQPTFLVEELLPELRDRYGISEDPRELGLMGASFGAVSSLYCAFSHPGVFGRLMLQSGSFVFTDVGHHGRGPLWDPVVTFVNQLREDPSRIGSPRIYMSCGTFESLIAFNRGLVPLLRDAGHDVRFTEANDGHNWIAWRDRLREGLTCLFPGFLWMYYD